ncbi:tRNA pseudouridine(38-40) synthase TruA [Pedobacter glucosidilyticus]|uniref:tRNA pseudouridine(38-40) synthase TruA n=1 Tax=Pedobacter glucosidilyticus TaxID=1122941 RepID=UPI0026F1B16E|nr:tRNA pseudouridine(38-40) synthase TruA [Pedobacter glucosidilyticus]
MHHVNRYFLELSYHGMNYHGWQYQPNAITVQQKIDEALSIYFKDKIDTLGCGRTDTGVHATQFFAHFDCPIANLENQELKFLRSLNALLPHDIAIHHIYPVAPDAHARFDATFRSYQYHIHFHKNPFKTHTSWLIKETLDMNAMNIAATYLLEYEDFSAFCKANADNFTNNCLVSRAEWELAADGIIFHITANRFLRNMVRAIVGTLTDIGRGKFSPDYMREVIESKNRSNAGASVPACGLFLTEVNYPYIMRAIEEEK